MPHMPFLENTECEYLKVLVKRYEDTHNTSRPSSTTGRRSQMSPNSKGMSQLSGVVNNKNAARKQMTTKQSSKHELSSRTI